MNGMIGRPEITVPTASSNNQSLSSEQKIQLMRELNAALSEYAKRTGKTIQEVRQEFLPQNNS